MQRKRANKRASLSKINFATKKTGALSSRKSVKFPLNFPLLPRAKPSWQLARFVQLFVSWSRTSFFLCLRNKIVLQLCFSRLRSYFICSWLYFEFSYIIVIKEWPRTKNSMAMPLGPKILPVALYKLWNWGQEILLTFNKSCVWSSKIFASWAKKWWQEQEQVARKILDRSKKSARFLACDSERTRN